MNPNNIVSLFCKNHIIEIAVYLTCTKFIRLMQDCIKRFAIAYEKDIKNVILCNVFVANRANDGYFKEYFRVYPWNVILYIYIYILKVIIYYKIENFEDFM